MNLIEGLHKQMDRARDLRSGYDKIESGWFGSDAITATIRQAERSIEDGDAVEMLAAYKALEALE